MARDGKSNGAGDGAEERAEQIAEERRQQALRRREIAIAADENKTPDEIEQEEKQQPQYWEQRLLLEDMEGAPDLSPSPPPRRPK